MKSAIESSELDSPTPFYSAGSSKVNCYCSYFFTDINECSSSATNNCHQYADCHNSDGSFHCTCRSGYSGDGSSCTGTLYVKVSVQGSHAYMDAPFEMF